MIKQSNLKVAMTIRKMKITNINLGKAIQVCDNGDMLVRFGITSDTKCEKCSARLECTDYRSQQTHSLSVVVSVVE